MSDLQDDIYRFDADPYFQPAYVDRIVEAARKYANPDIEAATEALADALHRVVILPGRFKLEAVAQTTVDAALGVTEDAHQFRPMEDGDGECAICHMGIGHESHWKPAPQKGQAGYSAWLENDGTATPVTEDE